MLLTKKTTVPRVPSNYVEDITP